MNDASGSVGSTDRDGAVGRELSDDTAPTEGDAMSRIWRAAGFVGDRVGDVASDRYIQRATADVPLRPRGTSSFSGRRAIGHLTKKHMLFAGLLVLVLAAGGVAAGRYAFPAGSNTGKPTATASAATLFAKALAKQKTHDLTGAERGYNQVIKVDPLYFAAYYDLGVIYQQTNRLNDATLAYEKTLIIDSSFQPALFNLAYLDSTSDPTTAISLYKRLQQLGPQNPSAVAFNLGLVYRETGQVASGNAQLRYAVSLDPTLAAQIPSQYQPIGSTTGTTGNH